MGLSLSTAGQHAGENAAQIMSQAIDNLSMYLSNTGQNIRNHPLTPLFVLLIGFLILFINLKLFLFIIRDPIGLPVFIAIIAIILYYWWNKGKSDIKLKLFSVLRIIAFMISQLCNFKIHLTVPCRIILN